MYSFCDGKIGNIVFVNQLLTAKTLNCFYELFINVPLLRHTRCILLQLVFDAVNECLPGSFNDVLGDADRAPDRAFVPRFDYYPHACGGARPGIYYADLIIDQMDILDTRVEILQRLSQSGIKCVDRAVTLADDVLGFVTNP